MNKITSLIMCIGAGILVIVASGQTRQVGRPSLADAALERQVYGSDLEQFTTTDAFYSSLGRTRSAGGMVRIVNCEDDKLKRPWRPSGSSLRQVLDAIVVADPRYQWQTQDDVINLLPIAGEPALLKIRIDEFHAEEVTSAREALRQLRVLPEVRKGMDELHLKHGVALINSLSSFHPPVFSVHCKDVSLRQALNAIAHAQGSAIWDYVEIHCDGRDEVVIRF